MKSTLIVCPHGYKNRLLSEYRKEPFIDVKTVTKEELLNDKFGHYSKKAISYLMTSKNYSYELARTMLKYARFVFVDDSDPKLHELYEINKDLKAKKLLIDNPYYSNLFNNKEVHVYGYSDSDVELKQCLVGVDAMHHLDEFHKLKQNIEKFNSLDEEIYELLNKIAACIDSGKSADEIYVLTDDDLVLYYIEKHAKSYGLVFNINKGESIYSTGLVSDFLKIYNDTKDIEQATEFIKNSNSDIAAQLLDIVNECRFDEFNFEQQLDYLTNVLKKESLIPVKYKEGINIISQPIYVENATIFVPNFILGIYPIVNKDNDYLPDTLLSKINLNTSSIKSKSFEDVMCSFFSSKNEFVFSYSEHSFKDTFYESPWKQKLGLKDKKHEFTGKIYSKDMGLYLYGKAKDTLFLYNSKTLEFLSLDKIYKKTPYRDFDNKFTGVNAKNFDETITHSYTSISCYCECPFKYYLDYVLKIDDSESTFAMRKGSFAHKVLEHCFDVRDDNAFNFDALFNKYKAGFTWSPMEEVLIDKYKDQLQMAVRAVRKHFYSYMKTAESKPRCEAKIEINIDKKTILQGRLDKCILLENNNIIVIDYKTGGEKFDPTYLEEGYSMQLPTYSYLVHESKEFKDYSVIGLYINPIATNTLKIEIKKDDIIQDHLKLVGLTTDNPEKIKLIDTSFENGTSYFIAGLKMVGKPKERRFGAFAAVASQDEFDEYESIVKQIYIQKNKEIRENKFPIAPGYSKDEDACKYCNYRDICYMNAKNRRILKKKEQEVVTNGKD